MGTISRLMIQEAMMISKRLGKIQIIGAKALKGIIDRAASNDHRTTKSESDTVDIMARFHVDRVSKLLSSGKPATPLMRPLNDDRIELSFILDGYHVIISTPQESAPNMIHHIIANGGLAANAKDNI